MVVEKRNKKFTPTFGARLFGSIHWFLAFGGLNDAIQ